MVQRRSALTFNIHESRKDTAEYHLFFKFWLLQGDLFIKPNGEGGVQIYYRVKASHVFRGPWSSVSGIQEEEQRERWKEAEGERLKE